MEKNKSFHKILDSGEVILSKRGVISGLILLFVYLFLTDYYLLGVYYAVEKLFKYTMSNLELNMVFYVTMLILVLAMFGKYLWASLKHAVAQKPRYMWIIAAYIGYLAILTFNMISQVIIGMVQTDLTSTNQDSVVAYSQQSMLSMMFMSCLCAPIIEEVLFRGVLFRPFAGNKKLAVIAGFLSALFFASVHVVPAAIAYQNPMELLYIVSYLPQGIVFAICCYKTENICGSIMLHFLNNFIAMMSLMSSGMLVF